MERTKDHMRESHEVVLEPGWTLDKSRTSTRFLMLVDLLGCVLVLCCSWFHDTLVLCGFCREICSSFHGTLVLCGFSCSWFHDNILMPMGIQSAFVPNFIVYSHYTNGRVANVCGS